MSKKINLIGKVFNRLTVIKLSEKRGKRKRFYWLCQCICGTEKIICGEKLKCFDTQSCGCLHKERTSFARKIHGMSNTRFYKIWKKIKIRCNLKKSISYPNYGGRGIQCEWKSFIEFKNDMYESYLQHQKEFGEKQTTIDRIDNNGNYSKENCRWATYKEQERNKRSSKIIFYKGERKSLAEWVEIFNLNYDKIKYQLNNGQTVKDVFK